MRFHIEHTTEYAYPDPASESFSELRLRPRDSLRQKVTRHQTLIEPGVLVESHIDYFGNYVETFLRLVRWRQNPSMMPSGHWI